MKILSVNASGGIFREGTAWHRISTIGEILRSDGYDVIYAHYFNEAMNFRKLDKQEQRYNLLLPSSPLLSLFKHIRVLISRKFDLIYANTHYAIIRSLLGKILFPKIPIVFDAHGGLVEEFLLFKKPNLKDAIIHFIFKIIHRIALLVSNEIFCVSKNMMQKFRPIGVSKRKLHYITNGVDLTFFSPHNEEKIQEMKKSTGLSGKFIIGYIGKYQKWQGVSNLLKSAKLIKDPRVIFLFIGGEKEIRTGNIVFLPRVSRNRIPDYYSICDVLVLPRPHHPSTEIAAPTKFAEYVAMGKPVLTTDVGDAASYVKKNHCGIVVPDNSIESLLGGLREIIGMEDTILRDMGKNARLLAEHEFDWKKIGKKIRRIIGRYQRNG